MRLSHLGLGLLGVDQEGGLGSGRPQAGQIPPLETPDWDSVQVRPEVQILHRGESRVLDVGAPGHHDPLQQEEDES